MVAVVAVQLLMGRVLLCHGHLPHGLQVQLVSADFIAFKVPQMDLPQVPPRPLHALVVADPVCAGHRRVRDLLHHEGKNPFAVQEADPGVSAVG